MYIDQGQSCELATFVGLLTDIHSFFFTPSSGLTFSIHSASANVVEADFWIAHSVTSAQDVQLLIVYINIIAICQSLW